MKLLSVLLFLACLVAPAAAQDNHAGGTLPSASPAAMSVTVNGVTILIAPDGVGGVEYADSGFAPPPPPDVTITYLSRIGSITLNWWKGNDETGPKFRQRIADDLAGMQALFPKVEPPPTSSP